MTMTFLFLVFSEFYHARRGGSKKLLLLTVIAVIGISGFSVNPVQMGVAPMEGDLYQKIREIANTDADARWIVAESSDFWERSDFPVIAGARTVNCTNIIPNRELWASIDTDGKYTEVYNRYAHINIELNEKETEFELTATDAFTVNLNLDELRKMHVKYILSPKDYFSSGDLDIDGLSLETQGDNMYIYRLK